jgi:hypothetical protein
MISAKIEMRQQPQKLGVCDTKMRDPGFAFLGTCDREAPGPEQRQLPCSCGHTARYVELRSKPVLTAVGNAECVRPYYLCEHCHRGQFPVDVDLDIENTELSPGLRRMLAAVGHEAPFEQGREQMELLAGLSLTTKAVERTAEAIGEDISKLASSGSLRAVHIEHNA